MNIIIDTGCANLSSVHFAIQRLGYPVTISTDANMILDADKVFLPGVGTVHQAMNTLHQNQLIDIVRSVQSSLLGICLGMQILTRCSWEGGSQESTLKVDCLNLIPGEVKLMKPEGNRPIPHVGWNQIELTDHPLFEGIDNNSFFYFSHSYAMAIGSATLASCDYGGSFSAAASADNFYGVQFHPELSSIAGAQLLKNFLEM